LQRVFRKIANSGSSAPIRSVMSWQITGHPVHDMAPSNVPSSPFPSGPERTIHSRRKKRRRLVQTCRAGIPQFPCYHSSHVSASDSTITKPAVAPPARPRQQGRCTGVRLFSERGGVVGVLWKMKSQRPLQFRFEVTAKGPSRAFYRSRLNAIGFEKLSQFCVRQADSRQVPPR